MWRFVSSFGFLAVALCASVSSVLAQEASREDFEAFCRSMEGRWIGEVVWVADWESFGKRGDKVTGYTDISTSQGGNLLTARFYAGSGSGTWTIAYDARAKRIKTLWVTSGGDIDQAIIYRKGDKWMEEGTGSDTKSQEVKFVNELTITDDGNTHTWNGTGSIAGKATDPRHDVWHRVTDRDPPSDKSTSFRKYAELMVGRWISDVTFIKDWPKQTLGRGEKATGYSDVRLISDGKALETVSYTGNTSGRTLVTFDPVTGEIKESGSGSAGAHWRATIKEVGPRQWVGLIESATLPDGSTLSGAITRTFSQDGNEYQVSGVMLMDGKPLDELKDVYRKIGP